jgi:hypothetical protein
VLFVLLSLLKHDSTISLHKWQMLTSLQNTTYQSYVQDPLRAHMHKFNMDHSSNNERMTCFTKNDSTLSSPAPSCIFAKKTPHAQQLVGGRRIQIKCVQMLKTVNSSTEQMLTTVNHISQLITGLATHSQT